LPTGIFYKIVILTKLGTVPVQRFDTILYFDKIKNIDRFFKLNFSNSDPIKNTIRNNLVATHSKSKHTYSINEVRFKDICKLQTTKERPAIGIVHTNGMSEGVMRNLGDSGCLQRFAPDSPLLRGKNAMVSNWGKEE
jgi:hypothetical protein